MSELREKIALEVHAGVPDFTEMHICRELADAILALIQEEQGWIKTTDRLPEKPGKASYEYVDCLIVVNGEVLQRPWNCEHLCWDREDYDDFAYEALTPTHWQPLPTPPQGEDG